MRNILIPLLSLLFVIPATYVFADTTEVVVDEDVATESAQPVVVEDIEKKSVTSTNKYFELELIREGQNPFNKAVPYTLRITPKIDAYKTQILWDAPTTFEVNPKHSDFVDLNTGQTYTFKANVVPNRGGTYDISVNAISWLPEGNFTNSVSSTITLSDSNIVQPVDASYTIGMIAMILGILLTLGALIFVGIKMSDKIIARIKIWLTPPM